MAGKGGRQAGQDAKDARLTRLWNQGLVIRVIAEEMGFTQQTSVTHAAKRLGLTPRQGNRNTQAATAACARAYREGKRDPTAAQEANAKRNEDRRKERQDLTRYAQRRRKSGIQRNKPEDSQPEAIERPTCFVCSGRSQTWEGHDECRGRRVA
jgi:hypothetical protein